MRRDATQDANTWPVSFVWVAMRFACATFARVSHASESRSQSRVARKGRKRDAHTLSVGRLVLSVRVEPLSLSRKQCVAINLSTQIKHTKFESKSAALDATTPTTTSWLDQLSPTIQWFVVVVAASPKSKLRGTEPN